MCVIDTAILFLEQTTLFFYNDHLVWPDFAYIYNLSYERATLAGGAHERVAIGKHRCLQNRCGFINLVNMINPKKPSAIGNTHTVFNRFY